MTAIEIKEKIKELKGKILLMKNGIETFPEVFLADGKTPAPMEFLQYITVLFLSDKVSEDDAIKKTYVIVYQ